MVEVMKIMATSFKSHACTDALSAPTLQQATIDPHLSHRLWTLTAESGSVSCGIIAPFSWVLVLTRFFLCPQRACFPCVSSSGSLVGLMATSSKRSYSIAKSAASRAPVAGHC